MVRAKFPCLKKWAECFIRPRILHAQPLSWNVKPEADIDANSPTASVNNLQESLGEKPNGKLPKDEPHRDEGQIALDTERSFVFYPVGR